jgi:hypothetical protein
VFLQNYGVLEFSRIFGIILLRKKIRGIGLQPHGPGPWAPAHESTASLNDGCRLTDQGLGLARSKGYDGF